MNPLFLSVFQLILYVKEGDNDTHFFHRLANSHRNANLIKRIEVDGVLYEDEADVRALS